MNEKWNQYFFGEPTEEEKRELFQEVEKNEDMKREFAEMQNIIGLSGLLPREDDSLKGERNLEAMMNRQEKKLRRKRDVASHTIYYFGSRYDCSDVDARLVYACWFGDSLLYGDYSSEGATGTFNSAGW